MSLTSYPLFYRFSTPFSILCIVMQDFLKILITMFYLFEQEYALLLMVILDTLLLAEASCAYDLRVKRPGIRALPSCLVFNTPSIQKNHNSFRG